MQGTQLRYVIKFVADMGHEREGRSVQHASQEAGFRRGAGAVRRFRRSTLQRGCGSGVARSTLRFPAAGFPIRDRESNWKCLFWPRYHPSFGEYRVEACPHSRHN